MNLDELEIGEKARVTSVGSRELEIALLQLGLVPGEVVELSNEAPGGDPIAIRVQGTKIAMRKRDARLVGISRLDG